MREYKKKLVKNGLRNEEWRRMKVKENSTEGKGRKGKRRRRRKIMKSKERDDKREYNN